MFMENVCLAIIAMFYLKTAVFWHNLQQTAEPRNKFTCKGTLTYLLMRSFQGTS